MLASFAAVAVLAASARAAPVAVSLATVEAALALPNTTQTNDAVWYSQNGNAGACGLYSQDSDKVVGLPLEFYSELGVVSPYCGAYVVLKNMANNETTTARVADASATNQTLSLSRGTWSAVNGTTAFRTVQWRFANSTETAAAEKALKDAPASAPVSSSTAAAQQEKAAATSAAPVTTTTVAEKKEQSTSQYVAPSSTYSSPAWTPSSKAYVAPTTTTTTSQWVAPKTTEAPKQTQQSYSSASSGSFSGQATYYFQNGNAGSCGNVNSDSAFIVAVNSAQVDGSAHCGQQVSITNTANGKSITATVADTCPSCSYGSLDLSEGAFGALGDYSSGVLPISWSWA